MRNSVCVTPLVLVLAAQVVAQSPTDPTSCTVGDLVTGSNPDCNGSHWDWAIQDCSRASVLSFVDVAAAGATGPFFFVSGHTDPASGREFALLCCANGLLVVDAHQVWSATGPNPTQPTTWFFQDTVAPTTVHRGVVAYGSHLYESCIDRGSIRIFQVTVGPGPNPTVSVIDTTSVIQLPVGAGGYGQFAGASYRLTVDEQRGHLYVPGCPQNPGGERPVRIYDVGSNPTNPCEIASWPRPGDPVPMSPFQVHLQRYGSTTRAVVSEYVTPAGWNPALRRLAILNVTSLPACNPPTPWSPSEWVSWIPSPDPLHSSWMSADGSYLYYSWNDYGTRVYDLRNFTDFAINQSLPITIGGVLHDVPPLLAAAYPDPTVIGRHHIGLQGVGYTGFAASGADGLLLYDLRPNVISPGQVLAQVDTSICQPNVHPVNDPVCGPVHPGNLSVYGNQDSGVLYVSDWTNGLYFVRANVGHVHRFGKGVAENDNGTLRLPRITLEEAPPRVAGSAGTDQSLNVMISNLVPNRMCVVEMYTEGRNTPVTYQGHTGFDFWLQGLALPAVLCGPASASGVATFSIPTSSPVVVPDQFRLFLQAFSYESTGTGYVLKATSRGTFFGFAAAQ